MTSPDVVATRLSPSGTLRRTPAPWTAFVYETTSGRIVDELPLLGVPEFGRMIDESGTVGAAVDVNEHDPRDIREYLTGWRHSLAVTWQNAVLQAGPITAHSDPDDGSGAIRIGGVGLRRLFDRRALLPTGATTGLGALPPLTWTTSLRNIVKRIVENAMSGDHRALPIVLPADDAATPVTVTYPAIDLVYAGAEVTAISARDGGPEIDFAPRFTADGLGIEHVLRTGTPQLAVPVGEPWAWEYGASLLQLPTSSDSGDMAFRIWQRGDSSSGTSDSTPIGFAEDLTLPGLGWPSLDYVGTASDVDDQAVLDSLATRQVMVKGQPVAAWEVTVLADPGDSDDFPALGDILPGGQALFGVRGHRTVPDGDYTWRVLGITQADNPDQYKIVVADQPATV